ncbi:MAG: tyrosine-protein phosphatase [Actinobacteria bacterium]|nr:tyrosine-protein phosphatase [Actinomycetota bacterium]
MTRRRAPRALPLLLALALALTLAGHAPAAASTPASVAEPSTPSVRVMTYNVLTAGAATSGKFPDVPTADLAWDLRDDQLAAWITTEDPDVIGFQENLDTVELDGADVLQLHTVVPLLSGYQIVQLDNADPIAFRTSRFTLVEDGATRIATGDGTTLVRDRWITHATLKDRASGAEFIVFNTHLSAAAEGTAAAAARVAEARKIVTEIRSVSDGLATPFVLTGDLNVSQGSTGADAAPLDTLAGLGLVNSSEWAVSTTTAIPGAVSLQSMTAVVDGVKTYKAVRTSGKTLDYVWVPRGALVRSYRVSTGPHTEQRTVNGTSYWFYDDAHVLPSDHNPVVVEVGFNDAIATLGATSTRAGAYRLSGKVYETYLRTGAWEAFGLPTSNRTLARYRGVAVWTQRFTDGTVQWSSRAVRMSTSPGTTVLSGTGGFRDALAASGLAYGVVYRSGDLKGSSTTGRALLAGLLAGGRIIDLRTASERSRRPDPSLPGVARSSYAVGAEDSPEQLVTGRSDRAAFAKVLARVAATKGPVLLHCSDNQVRTGWAVALVMFAAGASNTDVEAEYVRTTGASSAGITAAIDRATTAYGSMQNYLTTGLGLSAKQLKALKAKSS